MWYLSAIICLLSFSAVGQFTKTPNTFVQHLLNNKHYDEAILVLKQKVSQAKGEEADSLNLQLGKTYYGLQQLPQAIEFFDLVTNKNETLFAEAQFFSSFNEAYLKQYHVAQHKLQSVSFSQEGFNNLKSFQLSGIYLLQNNFRGFDSIRNFVNPRASLFQLQYQNFAQYRQRLAQESEKSPWVAGLLSTAIPGLGKVYAGRRGNGLYTFVISGLLAAQTYEAYRKDGWKSTRFFIYSSLFTSFYIGNVWGSALAVRVVRNEKVDATHEQILFDMHIPLRTLFR
jgi:curved DNA-binding protein CbpA